MFQRHKNLTMLVGNPTKGRAFIMNDVTHTIVCTIGAYTWSHY